ncbi:hypothetical protein [Vibrio phage phiKT1028]|nr:hypothetical protein [Vibrio phage phiKT1028]
MAGLVKGALLEGSVKYIPDEPLTLVLKRDDGEPDVNVVTDDQGAWKVLVGSLNPGVVNFTFYLDGVSLGSNAINFVTCTGIQYLPFSDDRLPQGHDAHVYVVVLDGAGERLAGAGVEFKNEDTGESLGTGVTDHLGIADVVIPGLEAPGSLNVKTSSGAFSASGTITWHDGTEATPMDVKEFAYTTEVNSALAGTIVGRVVDQNDQPVENATFELYDLDDLAANTIDLYTHPGDWVQHTVPVETEGTHEYMAYVGGVKRRVTMDWGAGYENVVPVTAELLSDIDCIFPYDAAPVLKYALKDGDGNSIGSAGFEFCRIGETWDGWSRNTMSGPDGIVTAPLSWRVITSRTFNLRSNVGNTTLWSSQIFFDAVKGPVEAWKTQNPKVNEAGKLGFVIRDMNDRPIDGKMYVKLLETTPGNINSVEAKSNEFGVVEFTVPYVDGFDNRTFKAIIPGAAEADASLTWVNDASLVPTTINVDPLGAEFDQTVGVTITGTLLDQNGDPIAGAITVYDSVRKGSVVENTNPDGTFSFVYNGERGQHHLFIQSGNAVVEHRFLGKGVRTLEFIPGTTEVIPYNSFAYFATRVRDEYGNDIPSSNIQYFWDAELTEAAGSVGTFSKRVSKLNVSWSNSNGRSEIYAVFEDLVASHSFTRTAALEDLNYKVLVSKNSSYLPPRNMGHIGGIISNNAGVPISDPFTIRIYDPVADTLDVYDNVLDANGRFKVPILPKKHDSNRKLYVSFGGILWEMSMEYDHTNWMEPYGEAVLDPIPDITANVAFDITGTMKNQDGSAWTGSGGNLLMRVEIYQGGSYLGNKSGYVGEDGRFTISPTITAAGNYQLWLMTSDSDFFEIIDVTV